MAHQVFTREDLTAGSDESIPRQTERRPESAVADRHAVGWDLLGTGPEVP